MSTGIPLRLLIVEDSADDAELMILELSRHGYQVEARRVETEADFNRQIRFPHDIILCDYSLPQFGAMRAIQLIRDRELDTPTIVITGAIGDEAAAECIRYGAADYLLKDRIGRLGQAVENAIEARQLQVLRRRLECELLEAQKLESVGRLAGGIAHDFNNMLTAVMGFSQLISLRCVLDANGETYVKYISKAAEKAHRLCRQLLAFASRHDVKPCSVNVNKLIEGIEGIMMPLVRESIILNMRLAPQLNNALIDPAQFEQIIVNLVVNARDSIIDTGTITIETRNVSIPSQQTAHDAVVIPGEYVLLIVADTGIGMDNETRSRLFEPFFTTKKPGEGTGLGLATAYGIVKQAGGYITVESEPGHGSEFRIYLPVTTQHVEAAPARVEVTLQGGNETIAVAEGDPSVRALVTATLGGLGYMVVDAGQEDLSCVNYRVDLLISGSYEQQGATSAVVAEMRRQNPGLKELHTTNVRTGRPWLDDDAIVEANYLARPFTPSLLAGRVRELLNGLS